jgi:hypothetical protein
MAHPGSCEAEGEGGESFYIVQSGRCPDLLVIRGELSGHGRVAESKGVSAALYRDSALTRALALALKLALRLALALVLAPVRTSTLALLRRLVASQRPTERIVFITSSTTSTACPYATRTYTQPSPTRHSTRCSSRVCMRPLLT